MAQIREDRALRKEMKVTSYSFLRASMMSHSPKMSGIITISAFGVRNFPISGITKITTPVISETLGF
jgi:hypothetical protein